MFLLDISIGLFIFGLIGYILVIFKNFEVTKKYFWVLRVISYIASLILLLCVIDFVVLDFISRYETVTKPKEATSTYDTIVYFVREYKVNFIEGIKVTLKLALLGTVIGLILAF